MTHFDWLSYVLGLATMGIASLITIVLVLVIMAGGGSDE